MIKIILFICASLCFANADIDYYWRDFNGKIPSDAFPAFDNMYVGQGLTGGGQILIGTLDNSSTTLLASTGKTGYYEIYSSIKILCTKNPEKLMWADTKSKKAGSTLVRVYGGVSERKDGYPFGTLSIARPSYLAWLAVGYHDHSKNDSYMLYVYERTTKKTDSYEELFYIEN